jgi:hypothetical protein
MSNPGSDGSTPEFSDSDRAWYAALSGEQGGDPTSAATREGQALRFALEQRVQELAARPELAAATSTEATQRQVEQLQLRAQQEGLFDRPAAPDAAPETPPAAASNVVAFPWWRRRVSLVGLAAALMLSVVVVQQLDNQAEFPLPNETYGTDGLQRLRVQKPRDVAVQLAAQLKQAGLRPGVYQRGKVYFVDVTLMASDQAAAAPAFSALQLKPAAGFNRVEIAPLDR